MGVICIWGNEDNQQNDSDGNDDNPLDEFLLTNHVNTIHETDVRQHL